MSFRRIVTGQRAGKSVILQDGAAPTEHRFVHVPGLRSAVMWTRTTDASLPEAEGAPISTPAVPTAGQVSLVMVDLPPDSVMSDPEFDFGSAVPEQLQHLPGFLEHFEADAPGMHRTPTVDYAVLLEGDIVLELDDGAETRLSVGDVVIQQNTRHAWRNRSDRPARLAFFMMGLPTESADEQAKVPASPDRKE